jgi:hypothetical protein
MMAELSMRFIRSKKMSEFYKMQKCQFVLVVQKPPVLKTIKN